MSICEALCPPRPHDYDTVCQELKSSEREQLALGQYIRLGTQNTQAVAKFALELSIAECIHIMSIHIRKHPECFRILKQNNEELYSEMVDRIFPYLFSSFTE
jgi:hypothetical protein